MLHLSHLTQAFHLFRGFNPDVYGFSTSHPIPIPPQLFKVNTPRYKSRSASKTLVINPRTSASFLSFAEEVVVVVAAAVAVVVVVAAVAAVVVAAAAAVVVVVFKNNFLPWLGLEFYPSDEAWCVFAICFGG